MVSVGITSASLLQGSIPTIEFLCSINVWVREKRDNS
jgi:hypothetical protein